MQLVIEESWLPARISPPPMTDEQFAEFCAGYPDYFIEMTAEGEILIMPPSYSLTGFRNGEIGGQLREWARRDGRGNYSDGTAGFVLPNGARRSPDAAWTRKGRFPRSVGGYWHCCPDFVIELRSDTDRISVLRAKMDEWIENGAQLGWLIDPERHAVEIFRPGQKPEIHEGTDRIDGEGPVAGFVLDLAPVWNPLEY